MKTSLPILPIKTTLAMVLLLATILLTGPSYSSAFVPSSSITISTTRTTASFRRTSPSSSQPSFVTPSSSTTSSPLGQRHNNHLPIVRRSNRSTSTRLHSFFGLGPAELLIVAIAGLIVIGPSKLLQFSKEAGSAAGKTASEFGDEWSDLKRIPGEFQKGVEEGEIEVRSRKAKVTTGEVDNSED
mmetsp:Transcript_26230/g.55356  ORF Transcript_26230/g.55356 Transcript_26230/m.55356 type:complete len:185 (-) Transcript_26230:430-984(-)|eukprot:CAMPEP_0183709844 /NCGR_PEP_ID=MMETSP0737-20130205/5809_1 /TAXON_ID=385413 /ORGANISM="Thalassiosira miniscula, Strain CCMP1093" /LENGTH=184 /DNA_ID=CAMNT_0025938049 /DNA_START=16 /DNA_END=570 /DNA_ORIENTATION=+